MATDKEKAQYFLDKVIKPGLQIDYTKQFDEMLLIMQNSDDPPVKYLGNEVVKFMERPGNTGLYNYCIARLNRIVSQQF